MAQSLVVLICVLILFLSNPASSDDHELLFDGFSGGSDATSIILNGIADFEPNDILKLTNNHVRKVGHAFYGNPIRFRNNSTSKVFSFSTVFAFSIHPEYTLLGGHGLAFAISQYFLSATLPSQYLGIYNPNYQGNFSNNFFAVEFDTVQDFEFQDIDDNHVGIDINSLVSNKSVPAAYYEGQNSTKKELNLKSEKLIWTWIKYDADKNQVTVKLSPTSVQPNTSILTFDLDLSTLFGEFMYVGFSASTGLLASSHYVWCWSFKMNGDAETPHLPEPKKTHNLCCTDTDTDTAIRHDTAIRQN